MKFLKGRPIQFNDQHPHAGHRGVVVDFREVDYWPELGQCPVVQCECGLVCMITDPEDARPHVQLAMPGQR